MGCDIHMRVEFQEQLTHFEFSGIWKTADYYFKDTVVDGVFNLSPIHERRDYTLFAMLADVRNYNNEIAPIHQPKGFPGDACEETKLDYEEWGNDSHSASYLTLAELKKYYVNTRGHETNNNLRFLISELESRKHKLFFVRADDEEPDRHIRIVFWFDN